MKNLSSMLSTSQCPWASILIVSDAWQLGLSRFHRPRVSFIPVFRCHTAGNSRGSMESRKDLKSIIPFLPLSLQSSSLCWPSKTVESLETLSRGPQFSKVNSGSDLFDSIVTLRGSIGLSKERLSKHTAEGYALFFDDLINHVESRKWFGHVVPFLANLLLRLPSLLEDHYRISDGIFAKENSGSTTRTGLRLLESHEAGIVFMSQELIGALLACSFLCLFPKLKRGTKNLRTVINFDNLFALLYANRKQNQEHKIKCIVHYFERIYLQTPVGIVSFERKVLPLKQNPLGTVYPDADFWSKSVSPLCSFKVLNSGLIEDQQYEALEIDFADPYIGGLVLSKGCVQEEIRFMINPELIISVLFFSSMEKNEAIEIIGAERFSEYTGYSSSFRFSGDYVDKKPVDLLGRRKTRIVAIDALRHAGMIQFQVEGLVREANKAFCGFLNHSKHQQYQKPFHTSQEICPGSDDSAPICMASGTDEKCHLGNDENIGIATGNWGCGIFGGDPELKSIIQWLAASQAQRSFVLYFTVNNTALGRLEEVSQWIISQGWTVGDLWEKLLEYSPKRSNGKKKDAGLFNWLLPTSLKNQVMHTNALDTTKQKNGRFKHHRQYLDI